MAAVASLPPSPTSAGPSSSTSRLEALLLVARSSKPRGAAAANLVQQAIAIPGVYFFGELFDIAGVAELASSGDSAGSAAEASAQLRAASNLLHLFAYGTYGDYVQLRRADAVAELGEDEVRKLQQLTLLSLARNQKSLRYAELHAAMGVPSDETRRLEDLIIESIYAGLIAGKLNQLHAKFEVHHVQGRDLPHPSLRSSTSMLPSLREQGSSLENVFTALQAWQTTTTSVLESLQTRMDAVKSGAIQAESSRQQHHQSLLNNLTQAQHQLEAQQKKAKAPANAMDLDEPDAARTGARKKSAASAAARGNKRSRA